ncbi:cytochrome P450 [Ramaria rubella]|nr:cytochrome P450 [Ramaria rubella]
MASPSASAGGLSSPTSHLLWGLKIEPTPTYAWAGFALVIGIIFIYSTTSKDPYASIPAIGRTGALSSYLDAIRFIRQGHVMLMEGYNKYKPGVFRLPDMNRWHILVSDQKHIDELRKAPDDVLSLDAATEDFLAVSHLAGPTLTSDMYHIDVVRSQLTRNISNLYPAMLDELVPTFEDYIPVTDVDLGADWTPITVLETGMKIISRVSNRIFVGAPTCRDPEWVDLNIRFTVDLFIGASILGFFPEFLKPVVGRCVTKVPGAIRTGLKHIGAMIEERQRKIDEYGFDYPDRPNDLLSWLMEEAKGEQRTTRNLTLRILGMNFAAIHTTSMSFAQALFSLAAHPECIAPIREEIETVIAEHGWNKVSATHMRKLDSLLKENQRMYGIGSITLSRKAVKEFSFSDGIRIPVGSIVSAPTIAIHRDESVYTDPETFNVFRFSDMREAEGEGTKNQMVATSVDYLPFGHGKHACPGRFFAANELKAMLAHLLLTYDIKLENEGVRPANQWFAFACVPNPKGRVLFRKRRT